MAARFPWDRCCHKTDPSFRVVLHVSERFDHVEPLVVVEGQTETRAGEGGGPNRPDKRTEFACANLKRRTRSDGRIAPVRRIVLRLANRDFLDDDADNLFDPSRRCGHVAV